MTSCNARDRRNVIKWHNSFTVFGWEKNRLISWFETVKVTVMFKKLKPICQLLERDSLPKFKDCINLVLKALYSSPTARERQVEDPGNEIEI